MRQPSEFVKQLNRTARCAIWGTPLKVTEVCMMIGIDLFPYFPFIQYLKHGLTFSFI